MSSIGVAVTDNESLTDMVWANAERFGDAVCFRRQEPDGWLDVTTREFAAEVLSVARGLLAAGRQPGERVPLGGTGYEWAVAQFAIWTAGCVSVPGPPADPDRLARDGQKVTDREVHARRLAVRAGDPATADDTHRGLLGAVRTTVRRHPRLFGAGVSMLIRVPVDRPAARMLALCGVYTRTTLALSPDANLGM
ncbi:AMP-binding protein [Actinophytocola sp.]|uniref:AMP-binding protein n=1 Tax=Actinophytocola sp. TaxID=1872138 RepID=UPI002D7FCEE4|nr:AMP-binding protein [Actinophytocola sp.]HET9138743.1 AMP-binding protein [Actinophytocola sp.]